MLRSLHLSNVTLFQQAHLRFSPGLNVFVGENGSGKSHLLKLAYVMATCLQDPLPTRNAIQSLLADKLVAVLKPEALGCLVRRRAGPERAELQARWGVNDELLVFRFATNLADGHISGETVMRPLLASSAEGVVAVQSARTMAFSDVA